MKLLPLLLITLSLNSMASSNCIDAMGEFADSFHRGELAMNSDIVKLRSKLMKIEVEDDFEKALDGPLRIRHENTGSGIFNFGDDDVNYGLVGIEFVLNNTPAVPETLVEEASFLKKLLNDRNNPLSEKQFLEEPYNSLALGRFESGQDFYKRLSAWSVNHYEKYGSNKIKFNKLLKDFAYDKEEFKEISKYFLKHGNIENYPLSNELIDWLLIKSADLIYASASTYVIGGVFIKGYFHPEFLNNKNYYNRVIGLLISKEDDKLQKGFITDIARYAHFNSKNLDDKTKSIFLRIQQAYGDQQYVYHTTQSNGSSYRYIRDIEVPFVDLD